MNLDNFSAVILVFIIISGVVLIGGCTSGTKTGDALEEEEMRNQGLKLCETTGSYEFYNFTTNEWIIEDKNTQSEENNQDSSQDTQTTTKKSTQSTQTSTSTKKTTTSTPASCSHPGITTKYIGLDKATGKIIYDTYCSKCGEYMGRTLY